MINQNKIYSDCCIKPIEFLAVKRTDTQTLGLYKCPKCDGVYIV